MTKGFERREVIEDANSRTRVDRAQSVPLAPVMRPQPSSFSKVGDDLKALGNAISGLNTMYEQYREKRRGEDVVNGEMMRAQGVTEQKILEDGNYHNLKGWQTMNIKLAQDEAYQQELDFIQNEGKGLTPDEYRTRLRERQKELLQNLPASSEDARNMIIAGATDMFPRLVSQHTKTHNEYNRFQTKDSLRKMIVSTAEVDGEESLDGLLGTDFSNLSQDDQNDVLHSALIDGYNLGSDKVEKALITSLGGEPKANTVTAKSILDFVGKHESNGNYNATYGGREYDLTGMTLNDVRALQTAMLYEQEQKGIPKSHQSSAVGKYQIIRKTFDGLRTKMNLTGDELFDEEMQDRLALALMEEKGVMDDLKSGNVDSAQNHLASIWAAMPTTDNKSAYASVGKNKSLVESNVVRNALTSGMSEMSLYDSLMKSGMTSAQINKVMSSRQAYQREQSNKFEASRLIAEKDIVESAAVMSQEDLIASIEQTKQDGGYSDAWANQVYGQAIREIEKQQKEVDKRIKIDNMVNLGTIKQGSTADQEKAIDMVTDQALKSNPASLDPQHPGFQNARKQAQAQVFQFMYKNGITDGRLEAQIDTAILGDIIDGNGKVKPNAIQAYETYLNAKSSVNDPLFATSILSDDAETLFLLADSYMSSDADIPIEDALALASAQKQDERHLAQAQNKNWVQKVRGGKIESELKDKILPGLFDGFYGIGDSQAQHRWQLNEESVDKAVKSPHVITRVNIEAGKLFESLKYKYDEKTAEKLALEKATRKVLDGSEYIAGTVVYTGDSPSIAERIGMGSSKTDANMVVSRVLEALGPHVYGDDWNSTEVFTMSQSWYESEPGIGKAAEKLGASVWRSITSPLDTAGILVEKAQEKVRGVPDMNVVLNTSGNVLIVTPYTNYDRTQQGIPLILPIAKLREAAGYLSNSDSEHMRKMFNEWVEEEKKSLPKYIK